MNCSKQQFMAQRIRTQYTEKKPTELDELKELDIKAKRPAKIFSYVFGSISAIVMGSGMSLVMSNIGDILKISEPMLPGIVIGTVGLAMALVNYPIFKGIVNSRKNKYAPQILALSDKIMNK